MFDMFATHFWCRLKDDFGLCIVDGDDPSSGCSLLGSIAKRNIEFYNHNYCRCARSRAKKVEKIGGFDSGP